MKIQYDLKRRSDFYIWKVVVPMLLVVLMSWSVFWIDPVNIGAQLIYNGDETESFGAPLDSFVVVNVRAGYDISETIEVFARIDNLFDEDYFDNSGFNTVPLSAFGGVRVRF